MTATEDWGSPPDWQCAIIRSAQDTATTTASFRAVMAEITSGHYAKPVAAVRAAYAKGGKDAAADPKKRLPGVLFSGTFTRRAASALQTHSGLICADLDELGAALEPTFELVASDPHTLACFRSPTGTGLKVVMRVDATQDHADSFRALEYYMLEHFGLQIDQACKDVSRICFVSHDPEAFVGDDAVPLPYPPAATEFVPAGLNPRSGLELTPGDDYDARADFAALLLAHGWSKCPGGWTRPGKTTGVSATFDKVPGRFYCFSSSVAGFEPNHVYRPWHVYAILEHGGDFAAAARGLGKKGFGAQKKTRQQENLDRLAGPAEAPVVTLESRRVRYAAKPPEPVTRLFLNGKPVCTPANLTTIISRAKTGKTTALGAAVAAILGAHYDRHNLDTFKFSAPHTTEAVVLIDTEQAPYDAWTCHQRTMQRAGEPGDPEWLHHYALVGYGVAQLRTALEQIIAKAKEAHGGIFTIILDGVADFVTNVNDVMESNALVAYLQGMAVMHNTPIICVIHSNEGVKSGDDGRGHLGKQLTRKAESNLLLKKVGEITTITSEKQRKAPITEADGVAFAWSDEYQRHVSCENPEAVKKKGGKTKMFTLSNFTDLFPRTAALAAPQKAIWRKAADLTGIKEPTFRDLLAESHELNEVCRVDKGGIFHYYLNVPPTGH